MELETASAPTTDPTALLLRLLDPATRPDPYPLYADLRALGPVRPAGVPATVVSSYDDCLRVLRDPAASSDRMNARIVQERMAAAAPTEGGTEAMKGTASFIFTDPPDHTRLRRLVSKAFTPRVVGALAPDVERLTADLLDAAAERARDTGRIEVVADLAYPLPVAVICRLLGVPLSDEPLFRRASGLLSRSLDPFLALTGEADEHLDARIAAYWELADYFRGLIAVRRRAPGDDLLSRLVAVEESGDGLTEVEVVATCMLLLIAGHETTVNLVANAALALLRSDGEWARLAADPGRAEAVVEETLRYDPPVHVLVRTALQRMDFGAVTVDAGEFLVLLLAGAQRDPSVVAEPDRFDPDRADRRHLGFGHGLHFCLGAPLARLEAGIAVPALVRRFPDARLTAEPLEYRENVALRGLRALPVDVRG